MRRKVWLTTALLVPCWVIPTAAAQKSCAALTMAKLQNATIVSAADVAAGPFTLKSPLVPPNLPPVQLPAYCRVVGIAKPSSDSDIKFEVWLPSSGWNGKFEQVGNGGFAGSIPWLAMAGALKRGYATAGTDDGHTGSPVDASWALGHPEKVRDFGYRAVHETAVNAKIIVQSFYGKRADRAYFHGCSDGGREALMEAQRFPNDFNGILAGAPANYWTRLLAAAVWTEKALLDSPASYIPASKLPVLQKAALSACDALDGVKDGMIEDPMRCHFDPAVAECKGGKDADCLKAAQVEAARKIYAGPKDKRSGRQIFPGFEPGDEATSGNWELWITGTAPAKDALLLAFGNGFYGDMVFENKDWSHNRTNFDTDIKLSDHKLAAILNATDPDLRGFRALGGKLIQYHGWADAAISPRNSINYYESVASTLGGGNEKALRKIASFYRLFMAPGVGHCAGGSGPDSFGNYQIGIGNPPRDADHDAFTALERWVEQSIPPERIIATKYADGDPRKQVIMTRPLCPYPRVAHFKGVGDSKKDSSFECR